MSKITVEWSIEIRESYRVTFDIDDLTRDQIEGIVSGDIVDDGDLLPDLEEPGNEYDANVWERVITSTTFTEES